MKKMLSIPLSLWVLVSTAAISHSAQARIHHLWFDDSSFFDTSWVDTMLDLHEQSLSSLKERMANLGPSKEQQEALKAAQTELAAIKQEISEDADKVTLRFSGFENLDKKDIKIIKKKNGWNGVMSLKNGTVEFFIAKNGVTIRRRVELNNEQTDQKKKSVFYSSSSAAQSELFDGNIDLQTVKVESLKDNTLTIVAQKKKEEVLPIP